MTDTNTWSMEQEAQKDLPHYSPKRSAACNLIISCTGATQANPSLGSLDKLLEGSLLRTIPHLLLQSFSPETLQ